MLMHLLRYSKPAAIAVSTPHCRWVFLEESLHLTRLSTLGGFEDVFTSANEERCHQVAVAKDHLFMMPSKLETLPADKASILRSLRHPHFIDSSAWQRDGSNLGE